MNHRVWTARQWTIKAPISHYGIHHIVCCKFRTVLPLPWQHLLCVLQMWQEMQRMYLKSATCLTGCWQLHLNLKYSAKCGFNASPGACSGSKSSTTCSMTLYLIDWMLLWELSSMVDLIFLEITYSWLVRLLCVWRFSCSTFGSPLAFAIGFLDHGFISLFQLAPHAETATFSLPSFLAF